MSTFNFSYRLKYLSRFPWLPRRRRNVGSDLLTKIRTAPLEPEALAISLRNTWMLRNRELTQRATWLGRLLEPFYQTDDPETVALDGLRLRQLYEILGEDAPRWVSSGDDNRMPWSEFGVKLNQLIDAVGLDPSLRVQTQEPTIT